MSEQADLSNFSLHDLFHMELEGHTAVLTEGLLLLEKEPQSSEQLESLMRAAHSIKGGARIVNLDEVVRVAHAMEDCFVAAQSGKIVFIESHVDVLLLSVDLLTRISRLNEDESTAWVSEHQQEINGLVADLTTISQGKDVPGLERGAKADGVKEASRKAKKRTEKKVEKQTREPSPAMTPAIRNDGVIEPKDRVLRISPEQINRLLSLAGEVQMQWQWLRPFADSMVQQKRRLAEIEKLLGHVKASHNRESVDEVRSHCIGEAHTKTAQCLGMLSEQLSELDVYDRSIVNMSQRLYHQTVSTRMQPFGEGAKGLKRMVRDLAKNMGKEVELEIIGSDTLVDRDILEKLKAPLNHLIRNAVDHGIEMPDDRREEGKPPAGVIRIEARHYAGMLKIVVSDDGRGVDLDAIRQRVVERGIASQDMVKQMDQNELMAFLYLPKFTMKDSVTEISGRGVGLDVVASLLNEVRGVVHTFSTPGEGMQFDLQLPITLSVMRSLLVEIGGEPYAFPLARIELILNRHLEDIETIEGRHYLSVENNNIGLVSASHIFEVPEKSSSDKSLSVIVLSDGNHRYGLIVDRFIGEQDLVVKALNPLLGKVKDISAAALMPDGSPLLIVDVKDVMNSIEKLVNRGKLHKTGRSEGCGALNRGKRILVVDDSITVREVERKLLASKGYEVEVAVDGMDGWNALLSCNYDLVISDVDMPHMDGIELVRHVRTDPRLKSMPIIIVSYKESDEDRMRGLEAGADSYLTKSSFHDETLLDVVGDLIGEA